MKINFPKRKEKTENEVIQELLKRARRVDCKIKDEEFTNVSLEDFLKINGEIYFDKKRNAFYTNLGEKWFRLKLENEESESQVEDNKDSEKIAELYAWGSKLKQYVDEKISNQNEEIRKILNQNATKNELPLILDIQKSIKKLESSQEDFFKEIKDYVDLKLNPVQSVKKEKKVEKNDKKEVQSPEKED
jgi:hypothetical protein